MPPYGASAVYSSYRSTDLSATGNEVTVTVRSVRRPKARYFMRKSSFGIDRVQVSPAGYGTDSWVVVVCLSVEELSKGLTDVFVEVIFSFEGGISISDAQGQKERTEREEGASRTSPKPWSWFVIERLRKPRRVVPRSYTNSFPPICVPITSS